MVTIGSNEKAIAFQNSIGDTFKDIAQEFRMKHNITDEMLQNDPNTVPLSSNKTSMDNQIKKDDIAPEAGGAEATPATTDTPATEVKVEGEANATATDGVKTEVNEVEALKNTIAEMEKNHASALETLKNEYETKLQAETDKIRGEQRANLAKVVGENTNSTVVKTPDDLRNKYIKK